ncbi:MAG: phosphoglycerate dehydrogenase-like enzyme [Halocynthiibacter sp.]|jgi:D-2-hydroxyacid dehydrogenase (NADP+)
MRVLIYDTNADFYAAELSKAAPEAEYLTAVSLDEAMGKTDGVEVLIALAPRATPALLAALPALKWIQALTTGIDNLMGQKGLAITNCHGIHGPQMSELCVLLMLASARNFPRIQANQRLAVWDRWPQPLLQSKTACIVGVGAIAEHLAGLLNAFGMRVTGVTSRAAVPGFAQVFPRSDIRDAVGEADFVVVLTPYSQATHHIIDAELLRAMGPQTHLINLARGGCVDEEAVAKAVERNAIAGAALDVFAQEPLPADSALWATPNLIITPHLGGFSDVYHEQALPTVIANMTAYLAGGIEALPERMDQ